MLHGKDADVCRQCYWANPEQYFHIATQPIRQLNLTWKGDNEVETFEAVRKLAEKMKIPLPDYVKRALEKHLKDK